MALPVDFAIDSEDNIWYTNWETSNAVSGQSYPDGTGILIKFDHKKWESQLSISSQADGLLLQDFVQFFSAPIWDDNTKWNCDWTESNYMDS